MEIKDNFEKLYKLKVKDEINTDDKSIDMGIEGIASV